MFQMKNDESIKLGCHSDQSRLLITLTMTAIAENITILQIEVSISTIFFQDLSQT